MAKGKHGARGVSGKWRSVSLLVIGVLIGTLFITPAGAHFRRRIGHLTKHMKGTFYTKSETYTKGASDARFGGRGRFASMTFTGDPFPGICDPDGATYLPCVIVELDLPTASRVLLNGRITASPESPGLKSGRCRFGSTRTNPVEGTTVGVTFDHPDNVSLVGMTEVFPPGKYFFGIDCSDTDNAGIKFYNGRITAVAISSL